MSTHDLDPFLNVARNQASEDRYYFNNVRNASNSLKWLCRHFELLSRLRSLMEQGALDDVHRYFFEEEMNRLHFRLRALQHAGQNLLQILHKAHLEKALKKQLAIHEFNVEDPELESVKEFKRAADFTKLLAENYRSNSKEVGSQLVLNGLELPFESVNRIVDLGEVYEAVVAEEGLTFASDLKHSPTSVETLVGIGNVSVGLYQIAIDIPIANSLSVLTGLVGIGSGYLSVKKKMSDLLVVIGKRLRHNRQDRLDRWLFDKGSRR